MAYKDILVYLDSTAETLERLRLASQLAKLHGGRLTAIDVSSIGAETAAVTQDVFASVTKSAGVEATYVPASSSMSAGFVDCVDLIVAPAPVGESRDTVRKGTLDRAVTESGVPVLILPSDWTGTAVGQRVVIAWNRAPEALRAVHDAMPFLKTAAKVTVFAFSSRPSDLRASAETLVRHLAAHGVTALVSDWTNTGDLTAIEALFASLDTQDADLIVAGAFGHSRLYEALFGGVSLDLLRQQSLPVLMSH